MHRAGQTGTCIQREQEAHVFDANLWQRLDPLTPEWCCTQTEQSDD